jgi:hypothetical protein
MACRDMEEKISQAVENGLDPREREALDAHLAGCSSCRREYEIAREIVGELRSLPQEELPPFFRTRLFAELDVLERESQERVAGRAHRLFPFRSLRFAWGSAAVLAVALVGTLWFRGGREALLPGSDAPSPTFSQAEVPGGRDLDEARMAALRAAIQPVSPLDDSVVSAYDVAICAALGPALEARSPRIVVDGRDVTALAEVTSDFIIFAPEESLPEGPHLVTVTVETPQGPVERSWIFHSLNGGGREVVPDRSQRHGTSYGDM